jgi:ABC-type transporter Mla maintaining outer membrane lipid asymmetry ATPase subunit MlaF
MLHEGRIHAGGTPDEIFHSTDPIVRKFVQGISDAAESATSDEESSTL